MLIRTGALLAPRQPDLLADLPCLKEFLEDDLRVRLHPDRKRCGHLGCIIQMSLFDREDDTWMEIAFLSGENVHTAVRLLGQAVEFIEGIHGCDPRAASLDD